MKTKPWALALITLCTVCTSFAVIVNKRGALDLELSVRGTILNPYLLLGLGLLGLAAVCLTLSLRGGDVSVIYPVIATSYIWATIMSATFYNENISTAKIVGIILIVLGVIAINIADKKELWKWVRWQLQPGK